MGEPVPAALDYFGCDKQSPDGSCVGLITPQVSCVRAPEDCDKRSPDGRGTPWAEDSFISSCFTLCMDVWFMDLPPSLTLTSMDEPVPTVLDYYTCVGMITPQVSCVRAP